MILEPVSGPLLTDPEQKSVCWRANLEKQTDCRSVFTMYLQEHQLEIQLESSARWREQRPAQHQAAQTGRSRSHQTEEQGSDEFLRHPGWRKRGHCPASEWHRDTKTSNRCKTLDMDYAAGNHPAGPLNKKGTDRKWRQVLSCHQRLCYSEVPVANLPQTRWLHE